jgi:Activator of Hsp90 ATPase homolog 1-like protein
LQNETTLITVLAMEKNMSKQQENFSTRISVSQPPSAVFSAIRNPRAWWSQDITGKTENVGDEFEFEVKGVHYSKQRLVEVVPNERVVWLVADADMTFIEDRDEWKDTKIIFDITRTGDKTILTFTHEGLIPTIGCYKACMPAWTQYVHHSLKQLIETGVGDPNLEGRSIDKPAEI